VHGFAGAPDGYSPAELRVFTNRDDLDFSLAADLPPTQAWQLTDNLDGRIELPTQVCAQRSPTATQARTRVASCC
jgi:hypothetical protein